MTEVTELTRDSQHGKLGSWALRLAPKLLLPGLVWGSSQTALKLKGKFPFDLLRSRGRHRVKILLTWLVCIFWFLALLAKPSSGGADFILRILFSLVPRR